MRGRLLIAFLVFALAGAVGRGLLAPPPGSPEWDRRASATNTAPRGARALHLWLSELGRPARSLREPLTSLGEEQRALFLLEPTQEVTPDQAAALFDWVEAGGVLFLAPGFDAELTKPLERWVVLDFDGTEAADVRGDRMVPDGEERWRYREALPDERGLFAFPVDEVAFLGDGRVSGVGDPGAAPAGVSLLFARDGHGIAAEIYHGDGVIIAFAESDLLTNRGLAKAHNAELVASLVEDWVPEGAEIWFDEYDHGGRVAGSLLGYLGRRRPALFALALATAGALSVLRFGRALIVGADARRKRRRRPAEFVDALGGLYARSRAVAPAWSALAEAGRRLSSGSLGGIARASAGAGAGAGADDDDRDADAELQDALAPAGGARTEEDLMTLAGCVAKMVAPTAAAPKGRA